MFGIQSDLLMSMGSVNQGAPRVFCMFARLHWPIYRSSLTLVLLLSSADNEIVFKEISGTFVVSQHLGINMVGVRKYSLPTAYDVWGKVMFSQTSVILCTIGGGSAF